MLGLLLMVSVLAAGSLQDAGGSEWVPVSAPVIEEALSIDRGAGEPALVIRQKEERSEEHTSELQSRRNLVCRLLLGKKKKHIHTCCTQTR